jgi:hypothetical protein
VVQQCAVQAQVHLDSGDAFFRSTDNRNEQSTSLRGGSLSTSDSRVIDTEFQSNRFLSESADPILGNQLPTSEYLNIAHNQRCNPFHHNTKEVSDSVAIAKKSLERFSQDVPIQGRIAVMILFSKGFSSSSHMANRLEYLRCALLKLQRNVMQKTTMDVFIWGLNTTEHSLTIPNWFTEKDFPRMHIIPLPETVWRIPCGLIEERHWTLRKHFDVDYYLMGRWRLTFSLDFVKEMGYEYHVQFDDDAMINEALPFDITAKLEEKKFNVALFSDVIYEIPAATLGLSELTAYWLKINHYTPRGPIFRHTNPHDIHGLTSDGYDRAYSPGYFMLFRVSWWFSPHVQDYLNMILRSGRDVEGRWQEQAVINMMIYIFVTEEERWVIKELDIGHDRHKRANFDNWCVKTGLITY